MLDAHRRTIKHLTATDDSPADFCVGLKLFSTGYTSAKAHLAAEISKVLLVESKPTE